MSMPAPNLPSASEPAAVPGSRQLAPVPAATEIPAAAPAPLLPAKPPGDAGFALALGTGPAGGVPVLGTLAAVFGIAALFKAPIVLAPLAIGFAAAALLRRQAGLGAIGATCGVVALAISPVFWALIGLAWLGSWLLG